MLCAVREQPFSQGRCLLTCLAGALQRINLDTGGFLILSFFTGKGVLDILLNCHVRWGWEFGLVQSGGVSSVEFTDEVELHFTEVHSELREGKS